MALQEALGMSVGRGEERGSLKWKDEPHGLDGVGKDDLLIRVPLLLIVSAVVNELHLLEDGGFARASGSEEEDLGNSKLR